MPRLAAHEAFLVRGRPFRRQDAIVAGVSRSVFDGWRRSGRIRRVLRGVYVDARSPDLLPLRAKAVALVLPPGAAVCRRTAAWLLGIDCRGPGEHTRVPEVECVVPVGTTPPRHPGVRAFVAPLPVCDNEVVMGVPRTTPSRTAIDLARWLPPFMGLGSVDAMAHAGLIDLRGVAVDLERWAGGRYVDQARRLITWAEPKTESFGESWLRLRLLEAGFPRPEAQIALGRPGARGGAGWTWGGRTSGSASSTTARPSIPRMNSGGTTNSAVMTCIAGGGGRSPAATGQTFSAAACRRSSRWRAVGCRTVDRASELVIGTADVGTKCMIPVRGRARSA